jgi:hypothetical protein
MSWNVKLSAVQRCSSNSRSFVFTLRPPKAAPGRKRLLATSDLPKFSLRRTIRTEFANFLKRGGFETLEARTQNTLTNEHRHN